MEYGNCFTHHIVAAVDFNVAELSIGRDTFTTRLRVNGYILFAGTCEVITLSTEEVCYKQVNNKNERWLLFTIHKCSLVHFSECLLHQSTSEAL